MIKSYTNRKAPGLTLAMLNGPMKERLKKGFDPRSVGLVAAVWLAALTSLGLAWQGFQAAHSLDSEYAVTSAATPVVPSVNFLKVPQAKIAEKVNTVKKVYTALDIRTNPDGTIDVIAANAGLFRDWMGAMTYLETLDRTWRWSYVSMCVGQDCQGALMSAKMKAETVSVGGAAPAAEVPAPGPASDE